jgi:SAM-dependent methyltransferase
VGVDVSSVSIAQARDTLPGEVFVTADITALSLPLRHFGLVTALNSVIRAPRRNHAALFRDVRRWLRPGGVFVVNVDTHEEEIALIERAGLTVLEAADHASGGARFTWLVCRRPA